MLRAREVDGWWGVALNARDPRGLAQFYSRMLGWGIAKEEPSWVVIAPPEGVTYIGFHAAPEHVAPVWPPVEGEQQMQIHLDVEVSDLGPAVEDAVALGARVADVQPQADVRVLLDPEGHPFCLYQSGD